MPSKESPNPGRVYCQTFYFGNQYLQKTVGVTNGNLQNSPSFRIPPEVLEVLIERPESQVCIIGIEWIIRRNQDGRFQVRCSLNSVVCGCVDVSMHV